MDPFRKYIITQIIKQSGKIPRATTLIDNAVAQLKIRLKDAGQDISKITNPKQITQFFNKEKSLWNQNIKRATDAAPKNILKGTQKKPFTGWTPKVIKGSMKADDYADLKKEYFRRVMTSSDDSINNFLKKGLDKADDRFLNFSKAQRKDFLDMFDYRLKYGNKKFMNDFTDAAGKFKLPENLAGGGRAGFKRGGLPAIDPRMQQTYAQNIAANEAQRAENLRMRGMGPRTGQPKSFKQTMAEVPQRLFGLDPDKAGVASDPSLLEYEEIKKAGLSPQKYAETSQYGLQEDLMETSPLGKLTGMASALAGPVLSATLSPLYDLGQGVVRGIKDPNKSIPQAIADENIWEMTKGRTLGSAKFLADQLGLGSFRDEMVDRITPTETMTAEATPTPDAGGTKYKFTDEGKLIVTPEMMESVFGYSGGPKDSYNEQLMKAFGVAGGDMVFSTPTGDASGKTYADGATTIPGFKRVKNPDSFPGMYNEFMYVGPDGQTYGAETYGAIAAGKYPNIYKGENKLITSADYPEGYKGAMLMNQGGKVGFNKGGLAPLLGEPTYVDDNHRVPYDSGKLVAGETYESPKNFYGVGLGPLLDEFMSEGRPRDEEGFHTTLNKNDLINLWNYLKEDQDIDLEDELMFRFGRFNPDKNSMFHLGLGKDKAEIGWKKKFNEGGRVPLKFGKGPLAPKSGGELDWWDLIGPEDDDPDVWIDILKSIGAYQDGGRVPLKDGKFLKKWKDKYKGSTLEKLMGGLKVGWYYPWLYDMMTPPFMAKGGRVGLQGGGIPGALLFAIKELMKKYGPNIIKLAKDVKPSKKWDTQKAIQEFKKRNPEFKAEGGIIGLNAGGPLNTQALIELYMSEGMTEEEATAAANASANLPWNILTEKAEGGRVPMWMGGGLGAGKALLREMLKYFSKGSKRGKSPTEILKMVNPKQFNEMLNRPGGIPALAKEMIEKYTKTIKKERAESIGDIISSAKHIKKADDAVIAHKKWMIEDMVKKGSDRKTAEMFADGLSKAMAKTGKDTPKITERGLLELENIHKNLVTKGRPLNAEGGLARMLGE